MQVPVVLLSHAVNLSGNDDRKMPSAPPVISANHTGASVAPSSEIELQKAATVQQRMPISDTRKHAVSLDEPATESPTISPRPSHSPTEEANSSGGEVEETSENHVPEILAVKVPAIVRNAPSETAPKIDTATPGAQLQVIERDHEWLHFLDPSSGNKGWIPSSLVAAPTEGKNLIVPQASDNAPLNTAAASSKIAKRKAKVPLQNTSHAKTLATPHVEAYAGLPPDEEFFPRRMQNPGFLTRRRMLREGLMSPGFLPPQ